MATSAAMPREMLDEKSSSLRLEARESRQAIRQVQDEKSAAMIRTQGGYLQIDRDASRSPVKVVGAADRLWRYERRQTALAF